jgi:phenylpropionate dioxygenase-like ring-hydroxylating dioxygenase large terminal subunit
MNKHSNSRTVDTNQLRAAPQNVYADAGAFEVERERIFDREWVCITRAGALPEPGDYVTARAGRRPIILVRQKDGSIRAFANVCLHRHSRLLKGCGSAKRIVCPYHAWTYDISGALIGVSEPGGFAGLEKGKLGLQELACQTWLGFVFVSMCHDLPPIAERLGNLADHLKHYGICEHEDRYTVNEEIWDGNWKLVFENFVECYHVTYAHEDSIGPTNPTDLAELGPRGEPHFSVHYNPYREQDHPEVHNEALDDDERRRLHVIGIYPNLLVAIDPNFVWWIALEPLDVGRTNARWGLSFAPQSMSGMADPDAYAETIRSTIGIAVEEDKAVVSGLQEVAPFNKAEPGYFHSALEIYVAEFQQYVARMMAREG